MSLEAASENRIGPAPDRDELVRVVRAFADRTIRNERGLGPEALAWPATLAAAPVIPRPRAPARARTDCARRSGRTSAAAAVPTRAGSRRTWV